MTYSNNYRWVLDFLHKLDGEPVDIIKIVKHDIDRDMSFKETVLDVQRMTENVEIEMIGAQEFREGYVPDNAEVVYISPAGAGEFTPCIAELSFLPDCLFMAIGEWLMYYDYSQIVLIREYRWDET